MPYRAFRVTIPVLVEDANNGHALAVQDKIALIVEAHDQVDAVRRLERAIADRLPVGFTFLTVTTSLPMHAAMRVDWWEQEGPDAASFRRVLDGRYEGVNRENGSLRFTSLTVFTTEARTTVGTSRTFEIPFEDLHEHQVDSWTHNDHELIASDQIRLSIHVAGHFEFVDHNEGGVEMHMPVRYVPRPSSVV
jgi:hypothetical protein